MSQLLWKWGLYLYTGQQYRFKILCCISSRTEGEISLAYCIARELYIFIKSSWELQWHRTTLSRKTPRVALSPLTQPCVHLHSSNYCRTSLHSLGGLPCRPFHEQYQCSNHRRGPIQLLQGGFSPSANGTLRQSGEIIVPLQMEPGKCDCLFIWGAQEQFCPTQFVFFSLRLDCQERKLYCALAPSSNAVAEEFPLKPLWGSRNWTTLSLAVCVWVCLCCSQTAPTTLPHTGVLSQSPLTDPMVEARQKMQCSSTTQNNDHSVVKWKWL